MESFSFDPVLVQSLISLGAGLLIFVMPRILNYIVAIYLVLIGLLGLFPGILG